MGKLDHGIPHHTSNLGPAFTGKKTAADHPGNIARDGTVKKHADVAVAWGQHKTVGTNSGNPVTTSLHLMPHNPTETMQSGSGPTPLTPVVSKNLSAPKLSLGMKSQTAVGLTDSVHAELSQTILKFAKGGK